MGDILRIRELRKKKPRLLMGDGAEFSDGRSVLPELFEPLVALLDLEPNLASYLPIRHSQILHPSFNRSC